MKLRIRIIHGIFNYIIAAFLFTMPWFYKVEASIAAEVVPTLIGTFLVVASFFSRFELGLVKMLSYKEHLVIVTCLGLLLIASPYIFNFYEFSKLPFVIPGVLISGAALASLKAHHINRHRVALSN
jgi:hypothetical protein